MNVGADKRQFLIGHLEQSRDLFEAEILSSNEKIWNARPDHDAWTIGECAEHVVVVEGLVAGRLEKMSSMAEEPFDPQQSLHKDELVLRVAERTQRVQSPPQADTRGRVNKPEDLLTRFRDARTRLLITARESPPWLRDRFVEHMVLKKLDGYQWLLTCSCHALRHAAQMSETRQRLLA